MVEKRAAIHLTTVAIDDADSYSRQADRRRRTGPEITLHPLCRGGSMSSCVSDVTRTLPDQPAPSDETEPVRLRQSTGKAAGGGRAH